MQPIRANLVFNGHTWLQDQLIEVKDGEISKLTPWPGGIEDYLHLDTGFLAPGFIDLQVNGGGGVVFTEQTNLADLSTMLKAHRAFGTTSMLPTFVSAPRERMQQAIEVIEQAMELKLPGVLGIHVEGPFFSLKKRGAHPSELIRSIEKEDIRILASLTSGITLLTLSPTSVQPGEIKALTEQGVKISIGHSDADYEQVSAAVAEGADCFTHLFNAMTGMEHRFPGVVGAALDHDQTWCGIINDHIHVHAASLRSALKAKPNGKVFYVSDAMEVAGYEGAEQRLAQYGCTLVNGAIINQEGNLAGSASTMLDGVRNGVAHLGLNVEETLRMSSLYPAQYLGVSNKYGCIREGAMADFVLLSEQLELGAVWQGGVQVSSGQ